MVDSRLREKLREFGEAVLGYLFARESGDESLVPELKRTLERTHDALSGSGGHISLYLQENTPRPDRGIDEFITEEGDLCFYDHESKPPDA